MFRELEKPHPSIKLLYTTPEQLQSSEGLLNCMQRLYERCVSISVLAPILSHLSPPATGALQRCGFKAAERSMDCPGHSERMHSFKRHTPCVP